MFVYDLFWIFAIHNRSRRNYENDIYDDNDIMF